MLKCNFCLGATYNITAIIMPYTAFILLLYAVEVLPTVMLLLDHMLLVRLLPVKVCPIDGLRPARH